MIDTNKTQPKESHVNDKYLEEERDEKGELTGRIISHIPRRVFTSSQVRTRPAPVLPSVFPGLRKVTQRKPEKTFLQSADLEDMRRKEKARLVREAAAKLRASKPKKAKGKKRKAK